MDLHTFFIDRGAVSTVFIVYSFRFNNWLDFEQNWLDK